MAVEIIMPKAGIAMEEGTVIKWLKKEGDKVEMGEPLLEILTDKVNMEIEAPASGVLIKILAEGGEVVPVTQAIGYIGEEGEKITDLPDISVKTSELVKDLSKGENTKDDISGKNPVSLSLSGDKVAATPLAKTLVHKRGIDLKTIAGTGSFGEIKARDVENQYKAKATPLAERIAKDKNIDLSEIKGSGHDGKILKEDLIRGLKAFDTKGEEVKPSSEPVRKQLEGMRKVIAERMLKSHLEIPPVTLNAKADVTELIALRKQMNDTLDIKISFNDLILKAVAVALSESPDINASIKDNEIIYKPDINIGMAVALEDGLIVPVIKNADKLSLKQISIKAKELAAKAREGKLKPDEYSGGTFTVSNMGMYGIVYFTPIINQPEIAILGICAIENELKMVEGKIENRSVMGLSLTFDHRVVDGSQSAIFLNKIKSLLENPLRFIV